MTINAIDVFETACQFRRAVIRLADAYEAGDDFGLLAPICAMTAFEAELLLKCILCRDGVPVPQNHDLEELFRNLARPHKDRIRKRFAAVKASKPHIPRIEAAVVQMRYEIDPILAATKDSFETWRYRYEGTSKLFYGLEEFCDAVYFHILEIEPEWREMTDPISDHSPPGSG